MFSTSLNDWNHVKSHPIALVDSFPKIEILLDVVISSRPMMLILSKTENGKKMLLSLLKTFAPADSNLLCNQSYIILDISKYQTHLLHHAIYDKGCLCRLLCGVGFGNQ